MEASNKKFGFRYSTVDPFYDLTINRDTDLEGFRRKRIEERYTVQGFKWNIGFVGCGELTKESLNQIVDINSAEMRSYERIGKIYVATSHPKDLERWIDKVLLDDPRFKDRIKSLEIEWHKLGDTKSQNTLETLARETNILVVAGDDPKTFAEICKRENIDEFDPRRRFIKTRANMPWVKQISPPFSDYGGLVIMVTNNSDDLPSTFVYYSGIDPYMVISLGQLDTGRLSSIKKEIRNAMMQCIDSGTELGKKTYETLERDEKCEKMEVFATLSHDTPFPVIYYDGIKLEAKNDNIKRLLDILKDQLKEWGFEALKNEKEREAEKEGKERKSVTAKPTARALRKTIAQIGDGLYPVCSGRFFDYEKGGVRDFGIVQVIYELEKVVRNGKETLIPRPCVVEGYIDDLFTDTEFTDSFVEQSQKRKALKGEDGKPLFPGIDWDGPQSAWLDIGNLYTLSEDGNALNEYLLSDKNGSELNPISKPLPRITRFRRSKNGEFCCIADRSKNKDETKREIGFLDELLQPAGRLGTFNHVVTDAIKRDNEVYTLVQREEDSVIAKFEARAHEEDELEDKLDDETASEGKIVSEDKVYAIGIADLDGGLLFYSTGKEVYYSGLDLKNPKPFAETDISITEFQFIPEERLVIGKSENLLYIWKFPNPKEKHKKKPEVRKIQIHQSNCDVDYRDGKVRILALNMDGDLGLSVSSVDEIFSGNDVEYKPEYQQTKEDINPKSKINLHGDYVLVFSKKRGKRLLHVLDSNLSDVCKEPFVVNGANLAKRYEVTKDAN